MTPERLIVFTRFPEPGRVKTRLIPALGVDGAAQLHTVLTRRTLEIVRQLCMNRPCDVEIRFAGGIVRDMELLFGNDLLYTEQQGNGLGERLEHAFSIAFGQGATRVVAIGTDCPEMEPSLLQSAFDALSHADTVLGPAIDGGYYLVGLRANRPELFRGVDWSTENVMRQTLENARRLECSVVQLNRLSDIDLPEDLIASRKAIDAFFGELPEGLARWYSAATDAGFNGISSETN